LFGDSYQGHTKDSVLVAIRCGLFGATAWLAAPSGKRCLIRSSDPYREGTGRPLNGLRFQDMPHVGTLAVDVGLDAEALGDGEYPLTM